MSAIHKPTLPTAAELQARLGDAERAFLAATIALGEALVVQQSLPDRDVSPEQDAVDAARRTVDQLKAMLPVIEQKEAAALAGTRAKLGDDQRRRLEKALRDLLKHSMSFSAHFQNAASSFRRMCQAGEEASRLLFNVHRASPNNYFPNRLSTGGLKLVAEQEMNRLGLRPEGEISAPGTNPAALADLGFRNAAGQLVSLEQDTRRLIAHITAMAPEPLPGPQESGEGEDLPRGE
jgi:hypothetical protein